MKADINEAYTNYMEICKSLSQIPSMVGFGKFILDSYQNDSKQ